MKDALQITCISVSIISIISDALEISATENQFLSQNSICRAEIIDRNTIQ